MKKLGLMDMRSAISWMAPITIGALLALPVGLAEQKTWNILQREVGSLGAISIVLGFLALVSLAAASAFGRLQLPGRTALYMAFYFVRMFPFWFREVFAGGHPGNGRRNSCFASLREFEEGDDSRKDVDQLDFGVHWHDRGQKPGYRVTWLESTGDLIAVAGGRSGEGKVEVMAKVSTESAVEAMLKDWGHAAYGHAPLAWVRRRAFGWRVPLPPRGQKWLEIDRRPPNAWPSPPPPSLDRKVGAYLGQKGDSEFIVEVADALGKRPLYHYVDSSPTGFAWGYNGAGPTDLAGSILADRLGYLPQTAIAVRFRNDVVSQLSEDFLVTFDDVDRWIDEHRQLFAKYPRAVPFDPYAAGGAY